MRTDDLSLPDDMDLLKAMVRAMAEKTSVLVEENAALKARSLDADARITQLMQILKAYDRARFGRRSEKLGDDPGPAGRIARQWSRAAARPVSVAHLVNALEGIAAERIALCLDATGPTPVDRAAQVVEAVLTDSPQMEVAALILADAALARSLGATHVLPLLALTLKHRDLRLRGDDLRLACHRAVVSAVGQALPLADDLARAAARLRAVAPKLRAKAAGRAVIRRRSVSIRVDIPGTARFSAPNLCGP